MSEHGGTYYVHRPHKVSAVQKCFIGTRQFSSPQVLCHSRLCLFGLVGLPCNVGKAHLKEDPALAGLWRRLRGRVFSRKVEKENAHYFSFFPALCMYLGGRLFRTIVYK